MRLIDADDFIEKLAIAPLVQEAMRKALNHMPTVDVVRCKDCKYGEPNGYGGTCYHYKRYETHEMSPNDFCSRGERREDGNSN